MQSLYNWGKEVKDYNYFKYPDGEDQTNKLLYVNRQAMISGMFLGVFDAYILSKPKGVLGFVGRVGFYVVPIMIMGSGFEITKNLACQVTAFNPNVLTHRFRSQFPFKVKKI